MFKPKSVPHMYTEIFLHTRVVTVALFVGIIGPASAQLFNVGGPPQRPQRTGPTSGGGWFGKDLFAPSRPEAPQHRNARRTPVRVVAHEDFSHAPPPDK